MGKSNYELTVDQKKLLDKLAEIFINKIEDALADDVGGSLDPYDTLDGKIDNNKLTRMVWYVGEQISNS